MDEMPFYDEDDDDEYIDNNDYSMYGDKDWQDDDQLEQSLSFLELLESCVQPSLLSGLPSIGKLLLYCLLLKFSKSLLELPASVVHLTSIATGLFALQLFVKSSMAYVILLCFLCYGTLFTMDKTVKFGRGPMCVFTSIAFLMICELFIVETQIWHGIRGVQMIIVMKAVSLGFDIDNKVVPHFPRPVEFGGYCFCVGTVIFGPWISYNQYINILQHSNFDIKWLTKLLMSFVLAIGCLVMSTCIAHWLIPYGAGKWLIAYRDALSFRSSHYFVSYLSEVTAVASGVYSSTAVGDLSVSCPFHIELPRSLTEVVTSWNIPMHHWLKTYVFKMCKPLGSFAAVLGTYAASSLLHGLNFQLSAVLLSLGFYTFIEHEFRRKLGNIFNACILARRCKADCRHIYKQKNPWVILTNLGFGALSIFHLAYLGVMFDSSSNIQEEGYDMQHTLSKWGNLNYISHYIAFGTFVIHMLI